MVDDAFPSIMEDTGERMIPEMSEFETFWEHIYRYNFATRYVKDKRVLDIACGEGYGSAALMRCGAKNVIGVDVSDEACQYARDKYGIDARQGDACHIPLAQSTIDVITSFETIEHIEQPTLFLEECERVLAPGGQIIISTPNRGVYAGGEPLNPYHCSEMSQDEFAQLMNKHFTKVKLFTQCPTETSLFSTRILARGDSCWCRIRGVGRLYRFLQKTYCSHLHSEAIGNYRQLPVETILQNQTHMSLVCNRFSVQKYHWWNNERPVYVLAIGKKRR